MKKKMENEPEVNESQVENTEEGTETPEENEKAPEKKPFWKSRKFFVGLGVLGGVAIATLATLGLTKASEVPYALDSADFSVEDDDPDDSDEDDSGSEDSSEE